MPVSCSAPVHMMQGSHVTYRTASLSCKASRNAVAPPRALAASRSATSSACHVPFFLSVQRLEPRPSTTSSPPAWALRPTITQPTGTSPRDNALSASVNAMRIHLSSSAPATPSTSASGTPLIAPLLERMFSESLSAPSPLPLRALRRARPRQKCNYRSPKARPAQCCS